jgi:hypothetical protein
MTGVLIQWRAPRQWKGVGVNITHPLGSAFARDDTWLMCTLGRIHVGLLLSNDRP